MRRLLLGLALTALAALPTLSAGQALANHIACGDVITQDSTLDVDMIDCPALVIGADDLTLKLDGHAISGVVVDGADRATIRGPGSAYAISLHNSRDSSIRSLSVEAVSVRLSDGTRIEQNTLTPDPGDEYACSGLYLEQSDGISIKHNSFSGYWGGPGTSCYGWAATVKSNHSRIVGNSFSGNGQVGLDLYGDGNLVQNNVASDNRFSISIYGDSNVIRGNSVFENRGGLEVAGDDNEITRNLAWANQGGGIGASGTNRVARNRAVRNRGVGIVVGGAAALVERNAAHENGDDGIYVSGPGATLAFNKANNNLDLGIEAAAGVIDAGGNKASGNGDLWNRGQCVNVFCQTRTKPGK